MGMKDTLIIDFKTLPEESWGKTIQILMDAVLEESTGAILVFEGSISDVMPEVEGERLEDTMRLHREESVHACKPDRDRRVPPPRE